MVVQQKQQIWESGLLDLGQNKGAEQRIWESGFLDLGQNKGAEQQSGKMNVSEAHDSGRGVKRD